MTTSIRAHGHNYSEASIRTKNSLYNNVMYEKFPSQFIYVTLFNPYVHVSCDCNVIFLLFTGCIMSFVYCLVSASQLCYCICVYGVFQVQSVGGHTASFIIFVSITETNKSIFAVLKCVNQIIHSFLNV